MSCYWRVSFTSFVTELLCGFIVLLSGEARHLKNDQPRNDVLYDLSDSELLD